MIAISYRREDSLPIAGRLYDRLQARFGKENVFMDFDSIPPGVDFREQIQQTIERSDVVIAVIGQQWFGERTDGSRRIDDPTDFVRLEIEYALRRQIPIIPLLVNNRPMPGPQELPEAIGSFAFRNGLPLDSGRDFHNHVDRIVSGIGAVLERLNTTRTHNLRGPPVETPAGGRYGATSFFKNKTLLWFSSGLAALVILAFLFLQKTSVREQLTSPSQSLTLAVSPTPSPTMLNVASPVPGTAASVSAPSPLASLSAETAEPVATAAATVARPTIDNPVSADVSPTSEEAIIVITLSADRYGRSVRTAFDLGTPTIYAMLKTIGLKRDDTLRAAWIAEFASPGGPSGTVVEENKMRIFHDIDGDDYFAYRRPFKGWTPGKYRLEIYLNEKQVAHSEFTIQSLNR